jgi:hypothetical protein
MAAQAGWEVLKPVDDHGAQDVRSGGPAPGRGEDRDERVNLGNVLRVEPARRPRGEIDPPAQLEGGSCRWTSMNHFVLDLTLGISWSWSAKRTASSLPAGSGATS